MTTFVLIHSPLVGPATWDPVADQLGQHGVTAGVPDLDGVEGIGVPFWRQHADSAARAIRTLPANNRPVLIGHSAAGPLLPAIREASQRPVAGYVLVDAVLPREGPRLGDGELAGGHFHLVVNPTAVAATLLALCRQASITMV